MKVYSPSEIASLLDIKPATLRKYSIMLEDNGYHIARNSQNHRYYSDEDIITLRRVITSTKNGVTLDEAIKGVVSVAEHNTYTNAISNGDVANDNDIQQLKNMIQQQNELIHKQTESIKELSNRLDKQEEYISKRISERDDLLMQSMNELLESKKQIAVAEQKKGFFARLFNK